MNFFTTHWKSHGPQCKHRLICVWLGVLGLHAVSNDLLSHHRAFKNRPNLTPPFCLRVYNRFLLSWRVIQSSSLSLLFFFFFFLSFWPSPSPSSSSSLSFFFFFFFSSFSLHYAFSTVTNVTSYLGCTLWQAVQVLNSGTVAISILWYLEKLMKATLICCTERSLRGKPELEIEWTVNESWSCEFYGFWIALLIRGPHIQ